MSKNTWNEANIEIAVKMKASGETMADIAKKIKMSRNAVVGKFYRMGLCNSENNPSKKGVTNATRRRGSFQFKTTKPVLKLGFTKPLTDLKRGECKYPSGDPKKIGFSFCGEPSEKGNPYCQEHYNLCYRKPLKLTEGRTVSGMGREYTKDGTWK